MFPGSEFSARTVLPWNLAGRRGSGGRGGRRKAGKSSRCAVRTELVGRGALGLRRPLSQVVRKVASEARECTSATSGP